MSLWTKLGFRENPYSTDPISANDEGVELLVGREQELRRLRRSLTASANHTTIEGANGVGKTSLVSIAAYTLFKDSMANPTSAPLYIPVRKPFQISSTEAPEAFSNRFLITLAREITFRRSLINQHHSGMRNLPDLERWLNDPIMAGGAVGAVILGVGGSGSVTRSVNSGQGFASGGVEAHLREMLEAIFPNKSAGGFVCVLDNLELLDTSDAARRTLEALRDGILSFPGVKWVLCGARGIIRSVVSTPRLQGKLSDPLEIAPLTPEYVKAAIEKRLEIFKERSDAYTPAGAEGFEHVYNISNQNLRIALKYCEDFVLWCVDRGHRPKSASEKLELIDVWFAKQAAASSADTSGLKALSWKIFDGIGAAKEGISPGDFQSFGLDNPQKMQPHLRILEQAALIESSTDETDKRRKTITLTPRGWIVKYNRAKPSAP